MSCPASKLALLLSLLPALACAAPSEEELFFKGVAGVNDGPLNFLAQAPTKPVHHHQNHLFVRDDSLDTGWVRLEQCHRHLDPVPRTQVVYHPERIRHIVILRSEHIGKAWVQDNTVQLEQVEPAAVLCIRAETRALVDEGGGVFSLANGPYMRRFLDGYYPMRVSMDVNLETGLLQFLDISPSPQTGFNVQQQVRRIGYEALFEGELRTVIRFRRTAQPGHR